MSIIILTLSGYNTDLNCHYNTMLGWGGDNGATSSSQYLHPVFTPGGPKSDKCVGQCSAESVIAGLAGLLTKTSIIINLVSFVKISHLDCRSGWLVAVGVAG